MARVDELRLMAKVARLYYERGLKQTEIAKQLDISQATISRLLKRAEDEQIVRINITVPFGAYPQIEDQLETA
jgi:DNA-binding transcriptional regulator LsrR (DeoR family)